MSFMKKIIASLAAMVLAAGFVGAQNISEVTEIYNNGAAALASGDKGAALKAFEEAYAKAVELGEEGKEIAGTCKANMAKVNLSLAKDMIKAADYDAAVEKLKSVIETAKDTEAAEEAQEAAELVPQVLMQKGNSLIKSDPAAAAEVYRSILADDASNGMAAFRLGQALNASGNTDAAVEAFEQAAANGQEKNAKKQISNIFLKKASLALQKKKFDEAVSVALKCNEYGENPQAFQIAGQASQLAGKNNEAINYFSKYLELAPNAKNAGQIAYTVGALYQGAKNNAKAKEYYKKAVSDPKFGAEAQKLLNSLQ